jgi:hypothetical protein
VYVGGSMNTMASPNDPVFFLHHANVDRLWESWQQVNGVTNMPTDIAQAPLMVFGVPASSTLWLESMGVRYARLVQPGAP